MVSWLPAAAGPGGGILIARNVFFCKTTEMAEAPRTPLGAGCPGKLLSLVSRPEIFE